MVAKSICRRRVSNFVLSGDIKIILSECYIALNRSRKKIEKETEDPDTRNMLERMRTYSPSTFYQLLNLFFNNHGL